VDGDETVTATFTEDEYTLTVTKVGSGDIDVDPEPGPYRYGDVVTLTATADPDWSFAGWTGDVEGTENPVTITMDGSKAVTATFTPDAEYTLTVNVIGNGSVSKTPSRLTYLPGEMVTLRAIPAAAWNFEGWSGDLVSADNPVTVTVTGDTVVEATFTTYPVYLPFVSHSTSP
jgi:uncharacterized repeat protein (TIGR02543 family)